jgi:protein CpxP
MFIPAGDGFQFQVRSTFVPHSESGDRVLVPHKKFIALSALAFGLTIATPVLAQQPDRHGPPPPAVMERLKDGRIAFIEASLKLTPEQKPLWQPVADLLRSQEPPPRPHRPEKGERPDLSDILKQHGERMEDRASRTLKLAEALKPLEAKLSDEQKQTLTMAFFASAPRMPHGGPHGGPGHPPPAPGDDKE